MTARDAERYCAAYEHAIHAIGRASAGRGIVDGPGHLDQALGAASALQPRAARARDGRALPAPAAARASSRARYDIGLNIDAEEADRLELSLDLLERLCFEPALAGWNGIGFVVQAYQKRCPCVIDWLVDLARRSGRRLMVRLVKGAYWDSEIKRAQVDGLDGYPVFTRKVHTDVAYLACAQKLLAAPDAVYPQFATHNAHTLAAIYALAGPDFAAGQYEFQCLHGMGEPLYEQVVGPRAKASSTGPAASTRRSARTRRCSPTSCGACSRTAPTPRSSTASPIRRGADRGAGRRPGATVEALAARKARSACRIRRSPLPRDAVRRRARNSRGIDLADETQLAALGAALARACAQRAVVGRAAARRRCASATERSRCAIPPIAATSSAPSSRPTRGRRRARARRAPPTRRRAGQRRRRRRARRCSSAPPTCWRPTCRALLALLVREAGKTCANAVAEVREAVDFLRYYARAGARATSTTPRIVPLGPGGLHQPVELPARDLHRPGRRGARRRQSGARQARRADAADRAPRRCALLHARRRAARRAAAPARPRRDRRRGAGRRRARARA